jgi:hypothetical protein
MMSFAKSKNDLEQRRSFRKEKLDDWKTLWIVDYRAFDTASFDIFLSCVKRTYRQKTKMQKAGIYYGSSVSFILLVRPPL